MRILEKFIYSISCCLSATPALDGTGTYRHRLACRCHPVPVRFEAKSHPKTFFIKNQSLITLLTLFLTLEVIFMQIG
jgi:hypothetical protein